MTVRDWSMKVALTWKHHLAFVALQLRREGPQGAAHVLPGLHSPQKPELPAAAQGHPMRSRRAQPASSQRRGFSTRRAQPAGGRPGKGATSDAAISSGSRPCIGQCAVAPGNHQGAVKTPREPMGTLGFCYRGCMAGPASVCSPAVV